MIRRPALSTKQRAFLTREWVCGKTQRQIGEKYGLTTSAICNAISDFLCEIEPNSRRLSDYATGRFNAQGSARQDAARLILNKWHGGYAEPEIRFHRLQVLSRLRTTTIDRVRGFDTDPRDVWLTFGVSPDPRLDNFYPLITRFHNE